MKRIRRKHGKKRLQTEPDFMYTTKKSYKQETNKIITEK